MTLDQGKEKQWTNPFRGLTGMRGYSSDEKGFGKFYLPHMSGGGGGGSSGGAGGGGTSEKPDTVNGTAQVVSTAPPGADPLTGLIRQIHMIKEMFPGSEGGSAEASKKSELEMLERLVSELKGADQCPNVNPFPLATLLQQFTGSNQQQHQQQHPTAQPVTSAPPPDHGVIASTCENQKQLLQQRLIDKIKGTSVQNVAQGGTQTSTTYSAPIPALRMDPLPQADVQLQEVSKTLDNERLLQMLMPQATSTAAVRSPQIPATAAVTKPTAAAASAGASPVALDDVRSREMFENIKKQINDQAVFNLTATVYPTSNEGEGLILVVTRNKIDIHPQFGPIHVARVVITNKLYYKFFVLDKIVDRGPVRAKEISEVFWKLSDVSRHLLCPGFNQRYISKVEQTLGEKVEDITASYCRLTAKMCTVWHQKDSKPGQYRNYHTRDLCSECLDLYHKLQFKTYSYTKMQGPGGKRESEGGATVNAAKKPKINGQHVSTGVTSSLGGVTSSLGGVTSADIGEQQLKAVLSTLVANSRVVQLNKATEGDDAGEVDILGSDCDSPASATSSLGAAGVITSLAAAVTSSSSASCVTSGVVSSSVDPTSIARNGNMTGIPVSKDVTKLGEILATLSDLQRSVPDLLTSGGTVASSSLPVVTSLSAAMTSLPGVVTSSTAALGGMQGAPPPTAEGATGAEEDTDLLVIQED